MEACDNGLRNTGFGNGDLMLVREFQPVEQSSSPRLRVAANVNGHRCFVKTFGNTRKQCFVDMLKPVFGLSKIGCNWAVLPPETMTRMRPSGDKKIESGLVLVCDFHEHDGHLGAVGLPENEASELATILCFDVWIQNNDRTASNVLVLKQPLTVPDGPGLSRRGGSRLLAIDETAAFQRDATLRMTAFRQQLQGGPWATRPRAWAEELLDWRIQPDKIQPAMSLVSARSLKVPDRPTLESRLKRLPEMWEVFVATQIGVS